MRIKKYTDEEFINAVKGSFSIAEVLRKIGVRPTGGNYHLAKNRIKNLKLDTAHFFGQSYLKGKKHSWAKKTPLSEILIENSTYCSVSFLKKRLFKENILEKKCYGCGIKEWLGKELALELEHKNGNKFDNRLENLTILCPNCHSLTKTYRGRNKRRYPTKPPLELSVIKEKICLKCNKIILNRSAKSFCSRGCAKEASRAVVRPSWVVLKKELEENSMTKVGEKYGVSDNAIRKWIVTYCREKQV